MTGLVVRWSSAVVASLVVLATTAGAFADDQSSASFPKPGPEHAIFQQIAGTWDAVVKAGPMESKSTANYHLECGGLWLLSDFRGQFGGVPFQGHGIDGYDPMKKKYIGVWVDSMSTSPLFMEGTYDPDKKAMVMIGEGPGPDGKPAKYRSVSEIKDKDHMVFTMSTLDKDGKANDMMTISYTRAAHKGRRSRAE
jgi:hypothetical protein